MKESFKRKIILFLILTTIVVGTLDVSYGVFFGVLTNLLIMLFGIVNYFLRLKSLMSN